MLRSFKFVAETTFIIISAILIALVIRTFVLEARYIPSDSMVPTLLKGDYLFITKYSYGFTKYSIPLKLPIKNFHVLAHAPERGDVVVFRPPHRNEDFIKRVIGLPGDHVSTHDGVLYINSIPVPRQNLGVYNYTETDTGQTYPTTLFLETLPNGVSYHIIEENNHHPVDNAGPFIVPEGQYFVMGDNRDNSADSREGGWFVSADHLIGKAEFTFLSLDGPFWRVWEWPQTLRLSRMFKEIK